jgi:hypothetical protein
VTELERHLAKLIVLRRVREERERDALAAATRAEEEARSREVAAEDRSRATADERARAAREDDGERTPAQVLQFRGRYARAIEKLAGELAVQLAAMRGERLTAAEAAARFRADLLRARRAREQLQERLAAARRERRRRRDDAEDQVADDAPGPPGGGRTDD